MRENRNNGSDTPRDGDGRDSGEVDHYHAMLLVLDEVGTVDDGIMNRDVKISDLFCSTRYVDPTAFGPLTVDLPMDGIETVSPDAVQTLADEEIGTGKAEECIEQLQNRYPAKNHPLNRMEGDHGE